jgi:hypothetical protein
MGLCCFDVIVIVTWWFLIIRNSTSNLFEIFFWTFRIIPVYCLWALWYISYIESLKWFPFHIWISTVSLDQKCYFLWANCCITLWRWQAAMESLKDQPLPGSFVLLELEDLNLSCVLLSRMCLLWTWLCRLWTWLCRLWTWLSCESKTCLCRLLYALCHMNMLYMQKFLSPVNCMCIDSETGKRHEVHLKATTCRNLNQTHGPTKNEKVAQPKMTRGQTWVWHVDHSKLDTWTNRSATCGAVSKSHIIVSMSARALPRQQPAWAVPSGIHFRDQFRDHLAWS